MILRTRACTRSSAFVVGDDAPDLRGKRRTASARYTALLRTVASSRIFTRSIEEDDRIHPLERTALPGRDLDDDRVGDGASRTSDPGFQQEWTPTPRPTVLRFRFAGHRVSTSYAPHKFRTLSSIQSSLQSTILQSTILQSTILQSTILQSTIQQSTIQQSTILNRQSCNRQSSIPLNRHSTIGNPPIGSRQSAVGNQRTRRICVRRAGCVLRSSMPSTSPNNCNRAASTIVPSPRSSLFKVISIHVSG